VTATVTPLPMGGPVRSQDELRRRIQTLALDFTLEVTAHEVAQFVAHARAGGWPPPGLDVFVPALPKQSADTMVEACGALREGGFTAVPHIGARSFARRAELADLLERLATSAGVEKALVIGGDHEKPLGPYASALDVIATGLLTKYGFREIAISGYPDGHRAISTPVLRAALRDKLAMGRSMGLAVAIVTQFTFEPDNIPAWCTQVTAAHGDLPIAIGLPGPARLGTLVRYAKRCGVAAAVRSIGAYRSTVGQLLTSTAPDRQLVALAKHALNRPGTYRPHVFTFGGFAQTLHWIGAVQAGRFELNDDASGFHTI
jgi:methylenetetrahydrofolate reductase (NADPH)